MSRAWWQTHRKRVLLYLHPDRRLVFCQMAHRASQDLGYKGLLSTFRKATLREGKKQLWLVVLRSFNEGVHPRTVAALIDTKLDEKGRARASIGSVTVSIEPDRNWVVDRR